MSKKTLILCVSMVMALALGLGGTLAYLTDRDAQTNIFSVGNVNIELTEDFQMGAKLIPGVDITKDVTVKNIGDTDAWVWVTIAIPSALDDEDAAYNNVIHFNYTKDSVSEGKWVWLTDDNGDFAVTKVTGLGEGDPNEYNVYTVLYQTPLKPGEMTEYSAMKKVYLDYHIDIAPDGQMYHVQNGVAEKIDWNVNIEGAPIMYVAAYAMQYDGFEDGVMAAYDAYGAQWGDNGGVKYNTKFVNPNSGATRPAGYIPAVEGEIIDGLTIIDASDDVTNLRALYNGEGSDQYAKGDLAINNSYLDGTYAMNLYAVEGSGAKLTANNSAFKGWSSFTGWESAEFTNCIFALNSEGTYNMLRPYDDTVLNNCELSGTTISLGDGTGSWNGAKLTLKNCTMNGEAVTSVDQLTLEKADWAPYITIAND